MRSNEAILLTHVGTTLAMVGLIWFVQVVHYPLFARVGLSSFPGYHRDHVRRATRVVAPLMLVELSTGLGLIWHPGDLPVTWLWANLVMLALTWASTFLLQVPRHRRLAVGFGSRTHGTLVTTNWVRTAVWTARGTLVLGIVGWRA